MTTINVSKIITKTISVNGNSIVSNHKQGDLSSIISGVDVFTVYGIAKPNKLNKIRFTIEENGFVLSQTNWLENAGFSEENSDVLNFSLIYVKQ